MRSTKTAETRYFWRPGGRQRRVSSERKNTGLRVALASYDVHQLRVWHQYIAEQSAEILCSEYRSGEERCRA